MRKRELACTYCGAKPKEPCTLVLDPQQPPLSITWEHRTREEAGLRRLSVA